MIYYALQQQMMRHVVVGLVLLIISPPPFLYTFFLFYSLSRPHWLPLASIYCNRFWLAACARDSRRSRLVVRADIIACRLWPALRGEGKKKELLKTRSERSTRSNSMFDLLQSTVLSTRVPTIFFPFLFLFRLKFEKEEQRRANAMGAKRYTAAMHISTIKYVHRLYRWKKMGENPGQLHRQTRNKTKKNCFPHFRLAQSCCPIFVRVTSAHLVQYAQGLEKLSWALAVQLMHISTPSWLSVLHDSH